LKLFWDYLVNKQLNWQTINLASLAGFVGWLRQSKEPAQIIDLHEIQASRKPATINVILGCLSSFYRYHNQLATIIINLLPLTWSNACLTCTHFRTSKQYLERHKTQLEETVKVIENAKQNGWHRIEEMNNEVACNLQSIIFTLENSNE